MSWTRRGISWAGLATGALAFAISTQVNYLFATLDCPGSLAARILTVIFCLMFAAIGVVLSLGAWVSRDGMRLGDDVHRPQPRGFIAGVSVLSGMVFALIILLQGAGVLMLGCEQ